MGRAAAALGVALALLGCGGEAARIDAGPDPRPDAAPEVAPDAATATPSDAAIPPDAAPEPELDAGRPPTASRCTDIDGVVDCEYETLTLLTGLSGLVPRDVHYQVPTTAPPPGGYPVVLVFQGSLFTGELSWYGWEGAPFGALHQARTVKTLLDRGYAVLTPEAHANGSTYWDTNVPPYSASWELAPDHRFMLDIFEANRGRPLRRPLPRALVRHRHLERRLHDEPHGRRLPRPLPRPRHLLRQLRHVQRPSLRRPRPARRPPADPLPPRRRRRRRPDLDDAPLRRRAPAPGAGRCGRRRRGGARVDRRGAGRRRCVVRRASVDTRASGSRSSRSAAPYSRRGARSLPPWPRLGIERTEFLTNERVRTSRRTCPTWTNEAPMSATVQAVASPSTKLRRCAARRAEPQVTPYRRACRVCRAARERGVAIAPSRSRHWRGGRGHSQHEQERGEEKEAQGRAANRLRPNATLRRALRTVDSYPLSVTVYGIPRFGMPSMGLYRRKQSA